MNKIVKIYKKFEEIIKYLIFGFLTTIISLLVYYILVYTIFNPKNALFLQSANIVSWIASVIFAYFTNKKYVFKVSNNNSKHQFISFVCSRIITLIMDMIIMFTGVTILNLNDKIIKIISQMIVIISNYLLSKLFVFKDSKCKKNLGVWKYMTQITYFFKKNKWYIIIFLLFLEVSFLTPISGDDWGNYSKFNSIVSLINYSKGFYYSWEGRIVSRFFIGLLTYNKIIWNIILPFIMTLILYFINRFSNIKNCKNIFLLSILSILIINNVMFAQTYTWVAGSITYLYPTVIVLGYFVFIFTNEKKYNFLIIILLLLINIIGTMFVENIGVSLVFGNILYNIYYYIKYKKISFFNIFCLIISAIGLYIMLKSPGSAIRMTYDYDFNKMSLINKVLFNKYNLIQYLYTRNIFMIILMSIPIILILFNKIKKKYVKLFVILLFSLIPILTILFNFRLFIPVDFNFKIPVLDNNIWILIYWIIFTILYILAIIYSSLEKKSKIQCLFMFLIGLVSLLCLLITPGFGDRVSFFAVMITNTVSLRLISSLNIFKTNKIKVLLKVFVILGIIYYFTCFILIGLFNYKRENYIKKCLKEGNKEIVLKSNPIYLIWNNNPSNEYHMETFKEYFHIPSEIEVSIAWIKF